MKDVSAVAVGESVEVLRSAIPRLRLDRQAGLAEIDPP